VGVSWGFFGYAGAAQRSFVAEAELLGRSGEVCERRHPIEKLLALGFVQSTPNAVRLADPKGVLEAVLSHAARSADRFGGALTCEAFLLALNS
jgi:hypothetical protein